MFYLLLDAYIKTIDFSLSFASGLLRGVLSRCCVIYLMFICFVLLYIFNINVYSYMYDNKTSIDFF